MTDKETTLIVEQLANYFLKNNKRLTVAESCTGGWIAKVLTDLAGSSAWFDRGFVTYSNNAKQEMLGVASSTLDTFGAVSEETVIEMAKGALNNSHTDFSLSVSGIAGPSGGSTDKPVGLVWFAWCKKSNKESLIKSKHEHFKGDRDSIREQAVVYALTELVRFVEREDI